MSYTVLAIKWRPKGFEEVVGQPHVVATLKNAIEKNKVAHAYMFSGPRGVGKTSCARILARALNCKKGATSQPCGECPSCLDITAGRSLDVIEIDGASNRGIDEIRTLRENVKFSPASGRYKVYIIDEVHQITPDGFNALLKTLEEPPEFVKFILATTAPQKVPSTILSRCQRMDFRRISVMEIISQLERIIAAEGGSVDREVLFAVARASDGALRDAESILDQLLSFSKGKVSLEDVGSMLGTVQLDTLFQIAACAQAGDSRGALALVNEIIDKGKDADVLLQDLIGHFRNLMVARVAGPDTKLIDLPEDICGRLAEQAKGFSLEELFSAFNVLVETQEMSRRMESVRIPLEVSLVRMCRRGEEKPVVKPVAETTRTYPKVHQPKPPVQPKPQSARAPVPPAVDIPPASRAVSIEEVKNGFEEVVREVAKSRMSVATYLREGAADSIEGNLLTIAFGRNRQFHKEFLEKKENKALIEKCFSGHLRSVIRIVFRLLDEDAPPPKEDSASNPEVKSAMDMFNGRLI
ncbi:MAG: DNA polymerase III subunit gamma/tau [Deltaproteobacteria bacterium]